MIVGIILALFFTVILWLALTGQLRNIATEFGDKFNVKLISGGNELDAYDKNEFDRLVENLDECSKFEGCFCGVKLAKFSKDITVGFDSSGIGTDMVLYHGKNELSPEHIDAKVRLMEDDGDTLISDTGAPALVGIRFDENKPYAATLENEEWTKIRDFNADRPLFFAKTKGAEILMQSTNVDTKVLEKYLVCEKS